MKKYLFFFFLLFSCTAYSQTWEELNNDVIKWYNLGFNEKAIEIAEKAIPIAEQEFGVSHPDYATSLNNLAVLYDKVSQYEYENINLFEKAVPLYLKSKEIRKKVLGESHPDYIASLNNLAGLYYDMGQYDKAEPLLKKSKEIRKKLLGEKHLDYATSLQNLGVLYISMGQYEKAEPLLLAAMEIRKKLLGGSHSTYTKSLIDQVILYESIGIYEISEIKQLGKSDPELATRINQLRNLAGLYKSLGQFEKAESLYLELTEIIKKIIGENNPEYATNLNNLAILYEKMSQSEKAIPLYLKSKEIRKKVLGDSHPDFITSLHNLAGIYKSMLQYEKAESQYLELIEIRKKTLGERNPDYAWSLTILALLYMDMDQSEKAGPLFLEANKIVDKTLGESYPDNTSILTHLAILYASDLFNYEKALFLYLEAINTDKKILDKGYLNYSYTLIKLADYYYNIMLQYEKAIPLYLKAKEIQKKRLGETHPDYVTTLNFLAFHFEMEGYEEKAEPLYLEIKEIRKKTLGEKHPEYAAILSKLVALYESMGQLDKAELLFSELREIRAKEFSTKGFSINYPDLSAFSQTDKKWSSQYFKLYFDGEYRKAVSYAEKLLELTKIKLGKNSRDYRSGLNNLALLFSKMGQYDKAEPFFLEVIGLRKKRWEEGINNGYAISLGNLAAMYKKMGLYEKAEPLYLKSSEIRKKELGENHRDYALSLNGLAGLYNSMGQLTKAEDLYLKSIEIYKKAKEENQRSYANSLNNLAFLYLRRGQYMKAEPLLLETIAIDKKTIGEAHPDYASSLTGLAILYKKTGQYKKAEQLFLEAKEIRKKALGETHPSYSISLGNLSLLYMDIDQYEKAENYLRMGNKIETDNLKKVFTVLSEEERGNYLDNNIDLNITNNSLIFQYPKASTAFYKECYNLQLLFKSLSLADSKAALNAIRKNTDETVIKLYENWQTNKNILAKQYALAVSKRRKDLKEFENKTESLEKELNRKSAAFKKNQESFTITSQKVWANLQEKEAAIEFVKFNLYNKKWTDSIMYAAYILKKNDSIPLFIPLCEEKKIQQLFDSAGMTATTIVNSFYRGLELGNTNSSSFLGTALYKLIWEPLEPHLRDIKKISYSPAGKLFSVAFQALPVDSGTVLMDKYELQQYTSTRQVALRTEEKQNMKPINITLFGNASFTMDSLQLVKQKSSNEAISTYIYTPKKRGDEKGAWKNLPGTAEEVKKIKQLFDENNISTKTFIQTTASEENLKALSGNSPHVLHIATHGFFLSDPEKKKSEMGFGNENAYTLANDPLLRSGLILSGGNYAWSGKTPINGVEDGIATAYEISQLNLSNIELVVLSACETALGDVKGSEGVFGLQRAFKMAGVKKMIVSLWQVPDKETAELMTAFYSYWMKGKTIDESFLQAQTDMRKKYSPFYWAAFVLIE